MLLVHLMVGGGRGSDLLTVGQLTVRMHVHAYRHLGVVMQVMCMWMMIGGMRLI